MAIMKKGSNKKDR